MADVKMLLEAGALLPPKGKAPKGEPIDAVQARAYAHPALAGRKVVRLTPENLSQADDLEMDVLGFETGVSKGVVGRQRRQALGFPGWALVHDPKNARHALDVVKELKKEARRAKSKPGHAKEGIEAIAKRLGRTVPQFLPSFYEEAGRAFIDVTNLTYAAQCFAKAREAENVHALKTDEALRRDAFVEFALAGAVTIKALTQYAKELAESHSPQEAYQHFRELCLKRTLGGMPPWAGMAKELRRLAKAAKLDGDAEDKKLVEEILEAPALVKASAQLWKAYNKPIVELAKGSAEVRGRLLNLFPTPSPDNVAFDVEWLALLEDCGALAALDGKAPHAARPAESRAAWMSKWIKHCTRGWNRTLPVETLELLERVAPKLVEDGKPLTFSSGGWRHNVDVDLLDIALTLGVPVKEPGEDDSIDLDDWAQRADKHERFGRDPTQVQAHPGWSKVLESAVGDAAGGEAFERVARGKAALLDARRKWLLSAVAAIGGTLPSVEQALSTLTEKTTAQTFAEIPEAYANLEKARIAPALQATLVGGVLDELGWDALDEAAQDIVDGGSFKAYGSWPFVILSDDQRAVVVGPEGKVLDHELQVPKKSEIKRLLYAGGQLMVIFEARDTIRSYWSSAPKTKSTWEQRYFWYTESWGYGLHFDDGGFYGGGKVVHPGDAATDRDYGRFVSDGETVWTGEWSDGYRLRETDPKTGGKGRRSLPAWFEAFAGSEWELDLHNSELVPMPYVKTSPLGAKDGMYGLRIRDARGDDDSRTEAEATDGRTFAGTPKALVSWPGGGMLRLEEEYSYGEAVSYKLFAADGDDPPCLGEPSTGSRAYRSGTPFLAAHHYWHFFTARDDKGSKALRKLSAAKAKALLGAPSPADEGDELAPVVGHVEATLPKVTHPRLQRGIAGVVAHAQKLQERLDQLLETRHPDASTAMGAVALSDEEVAELDSDLRDGWEDGSVADQIGSVVRAAAGKKTGYVMSTVSWWKLPGRLGEIAFTSVAFGTDDKKRDIALRLLSIWADTPFVEAPETIRHSSVIFGKKGAPIRTLVEEDSAYGMGSLGDSVVLVRCDWVEDDSEWDVIEYAPGGSFTKLPGKIESQTKPKKGSWPSGGKGSASERLVAFVEVARERGKMPWSPQAVEALVEETGLTFAEAALLWAGRPHFDSWETHFLPKALREEMGLKSKDAGVARSAIKELDDDKLRRFYDGAIPDDPALLWDDPVEAARRFGKRYLKVFGKRLTIPAELLANVERVLPYGVTSREAVTMMADPQSADELTKDGVFVITHDDDEPSQKSKGQCFDDDQLGVVARLVPYLFQELPVGDPFRAGVAEAVELVQARLKNDQLLISGFSIWDSNEKSRKALLDGFGGKPYKAPGAKKTIKATSRDNGAAVIVVSEWGSISVAIRPAKWRDGDAVSKLVPADGTLEAIRRMRSKDYLAFGKRVKKTPVPAGGYEVNPLLSVPKLVATVVEEQGLSEDAAVLYLQTLAILNPASKDVRVWNGWTPARYKKAAKELLGQKLVIEAKRSRAGRAHFLPGAWEALKSPHPPFESWKRKLYGLEEAGALQMPLGHLLAPAPIHLLFERAYQRVKDGDLPRYEKVKKK